MVAKQNLKQKKRAHSSAPVKLFTQTPSLGFIIVASTAAVATSTAAITTSAVTTALVIRKGRDVKQLKEYQCADQPRRHHPFLPHQAPVLPRVRRLQPTVYSRHLLALALAAVHVLANASHAAAAGRTTAAAAALTVHVVFVDATLRKRCLALGQRL